MLIYKYCGGEVAKWRSGEYTYIYTSSVYVYMPIHIYISKTSNATASQSIHMDRIETGNYKYIIHITVGSYYSEFLLHGICIIPVKLNDLLYRLKVMGKLIIDIAVFKADKYV